MRVIDFRLRPPYKGFADLSLYTDLEGGIKKCSRRLGFVLPESARRFSMEMLINEMDAQGVEVGVVPIRKGQSDNNRDLVDIMQEYPGRFVGFAGLNPLDSWEKCRAEIDTYVINGPCKGIVMEPAFCAEPLHANDKRIFPIYEYCQEHSIPVMLQFGGLFVPEQGLFWPNDLDIVSTHFPKMNLIAVHGGYPFVTEMCHVALNRTNVYVSADCYISTNIPGYQDYVTAMNGCIRDRMVFGSAYPINSIESVIASYKSIGIKPDVLEDIMYNNAAKLLEL